jgi:WhiB family redox-sensing transcriptional regulator
MAARPRQADAWEQAGAWAEQAACKGKRHIFYPGAGQDQAHAKAICARCPVQEECLDYAVEHEPHGIWGGASQRERRRIRALRAKMAS